MSNVPWDKVGKGTVAAVPTAGLLYLIFTLLAGSLEAKAERSVVDLQVNGVKGQIAGLKEDLNKKVNADVVDGIEDNVNRQGEVIEAVQKEQRVHGEKLIRIEVKQEEMNRTQQKMDDAVQEILRAVREARENNANRGG